MNTIQKLVRLNLHLRSDHLGRLTALAGTLGKRKGRETRLAEAIELVLTAGLAWNDADLLDLAKGDREEHCWVALGPIVRSR
ncbi:hypothetical protein J2Y83_000180 [Pseudomonas marginalis]|uniref:hypothetical protein n=1 Tax=Pseudomonas TaxID=286 RepID=UPI001CC034E9|nr:MULTISPECIES: hypothetical protein [Pseudomonas]MCP1510053.1 hypothetical protein [Pseudomonas marginalis]MCP1521711.1 hypothetical protein [Pseudomonas marginalis]MDQ0503135.1 hypothetical protein [Pseudomonas marginalis]